jgi:methanogenic corrinoid protein MtbC1
MGLGRHDVSAVKRSSDEPASAVSADALEGFVRALLAGDRAAGESIVDQVLSSGATVPQLYEGLMKPALYRVGDLWAQNQISVTSEQVATTLTEGLLDRVYPAVVNPCRCGRKVVLATVEGELHQVGLKMVGDIFEMHGWDTCLATAGLPLCPLLELIAQERPELVALSMSVSFHLDRLEHMLQAIGTAHPTVPILVGGQGVVHGVQERLAAVPRVVTIRSLDDLHRLLQAELARIDWSMGDHA